MREIKFRAWDPDRKRMYSGDQIERYDHLKSFLSYGELQVYRVWNGDWHQLTPLQYTGLTDRNGKEIYEGDIVNLDGYDSHGDFGEYKVEFSGTFKVIWHNEIASFDLQRINATVDGWMLSHDSKDDLEVIGNIYEHPHLLEQPQAIGTTEPTEPLNPEGAEAVSGLTKEEQR